MDSSAIGNYSLDMGNSNELESIERKIEELGREEETNIEGNRN